jgi:hypothetical protein
MVEGCRLTGDPFMSIETVRVYDFDTKQITTIPRTELAPGMVRANVQGIEGEVFIDATKVKESQRQREPSDLDEVRPLLDQIYEIIREVYPVTPEEWLDGFLRDANPENEVRIWWIMAQAFKEYTVDITIPDRRQDVFNLILSAFTNGPDAALATVPLRELPRQKAQEIIEDMKRRSAEPPDAEA